LYRSCGNGEIGVLVFGASRGIARNARTIGRGVSMMRPN